MFNDCGVAVEMLRRNHGLKRIAYVDIDAHHGDGMYYGFESDPDLIFADIHEDGRYLYPGTGARERNRPRRGAPAPSSTFPVPPGADDAVFDAEWPRVLAHLRKFEPEFILLQAGADSVEGDPITHMRFTRRNAPARGARPARAGRRAGPRTRAGHGRRRLQPHQPRPGLVRGRAGIGRYAGAGPGMHDSASLKHNS